MCPRGQFLQVGVNAGHDAWPLCDGQRDDKCAAACMNRFTTGLESRAAAETAQWQQFIAARQAAVRDAQQHVDLFVAPSRHLRERFVNEGGLPRERMVLLGAAALCHLLCAAAGSRIRLRLRL